MSAELSREARRTARRAVWGAWVAGVVVVLCAAGCKSETAREDGDAPGAPAQEMGGAAAVHKFGASEPGERGAEEEDHHAENPECRVTEAWKGNKAFRNYGYPGKREGYVEFWHADLPTANYLCVRKGFGSGVFTQTSAPDAKNWAPYHNLEVVRVKGDGTIEALCTSGSDCTAKKVPFIQELRCCK